MSYLVKACGTRGHYSGGNMGQVRNVVLKTLVLLVAVFLGVAALSPSLSNAIQTALGA